MTRLVVAPGGVITSAWGNATHDNGLIEFTNAAQRTADWPAPGDGSLSYLLDTHTPWIYRSGAWHPYPLGWLAQATGPASSTDYTTLATVATMANVPLVTGRRYRLNLWVTATQVTTAATSYLQVVDSTGQLATSRYFQANLAAGETIGGGSSRTFAATATGNATFTAQALSTASAFRIAANACEISIEDIGG